MQFDDYVRDNGQSLLRAAFLLTGDAHRAEDLTQTVLATAFRKWRRIEHADSPHAYVRRMLVNAHLDWKRRRSSSERPADLLDAETTLSADPADDVASRDHLRTVLSGLAPRVRTVLVLRYYCDLDDAAIAEAMDISPGTVRATATRALAALRTDGAEGVLGETR